MHIAIPTVFALALTTQIQEPMPTPMPMPTPSPGLSIFNRFEQSTDTAAMLALMEALRTDDDAGVRRTAAWALGQMEDARAVPAMGEALQEISDTLVRAAMMDRIVHWLPAHCYLAEEWRQE